VRRLHPPTLTQWTCAHQWKTTTSRPGQGDIVRMRYLSCQHCGLKVKTEERLAVPWNQRDLVTQIKALLPEGEAVALRDKGITDLPLQVLNAILARQGYVIHASKVRDPKRSVACTDQDGRVERFGLFELRRIAPEAPARSADRPKPREKSLSPDGGAAGN
jgi:hypothetical protein